ncbi:hypothetical protein KCTC52924_00840 [Arenibacter antarcticus]|uniref:Peptidoglycan-binding protein LysM n=1 Tax=Arenibacter antarcticus TaxID=2040469 RepID=A0ABW5VA98_9FLAO|nr:peptidoglycan-binding protein LysM [Arenibacter sp. H213]MCM4167649.1 peptidoglycan-binding protein LysM [Arenibacter sp. H213]
MKKQIITATLALGAIVFGTNNVMAQNATDEATATVNIQLADVISIDLGSGTESVDFKYLTAASYNTTQTIEKPNSLIVTSTESFNINVKADGLNFKNGTEEIPVGVLWIKPATGGEMDGNQVNVNLSNSDQALVTGASLGSEVVLNLDYEILGTDAATTILGKKPGTYTQTVTYTATAI